jgi:hypothetical protein
VIDREKVLSGLERKRSQFEGYAGGLRHQREAIQTRLAKLQGYSHQELSDFLQQFGESPVGALPTPEWDAAKELCLPFGQRWSTHEEARTWAREVLTGRPVAAVDGSQIPPSKDFNIPVAAVQVGWFVNPHQAGVPYTKDLTFDVLGPAELADDVEEAVDDRAMSSWRVNFERFARECEQLCTIMASYADVPLRSRPLCFFDGSLLISFALQLRPERVDQYAAAVADLLECTLKYKVPLVAFVDRSYSRDFATLLDLVSGASGGEALTLSDAWLFDSLLPHWGDRSPLFYCDREDTFNRKDRPTYYNGVAFTYMRLTRDRVPARIEMPYWMVDAGIVDDVLNLVRAECVVGAGYPYAVETADALAVISHADRERFYSLFEQFAQKAGMELVQARKAASKVTRR